MMINMLQEKCPPLHHLFADQAVPEFLEHPLLCNQKQ